MKMFLAHLVNVANTSMTIYLYAIIESVTFEAVLKNSMSACHIVITPQAVC